jgi:MipA family protein
MRAAVGALIVPVLGLCHAAAAAGAAERELMLGVGVETSPEYEGGKDLRSGLASFIYARRGRFSFEDGVHYDLLGTSGAALSVGASYDGGRRDSRGKRYGILGSDHLRGLGRIDGAATLDMRARASLGQLEFSAGAKRWLHDEDFATLELGMHYTTALMEGLSAVAGVSGMWANRSYMQSFFGVSPAQSQASGFAQYAAQNGVKSVRADIELAWMLTPKWVLVSSLSETMLIGDARSSPIVQKREQLAGLVAVVRRF